MSQDTFNVVQSDTLSLPKKYMVDVNNKIA